VKIEAAEVHGVTSPKAVIVIVTAVRNPDLTERQSK
jgi:hypothetical protein